MNNPTRNTLDLNGTEWTLCRLSNSERIPARVPGCVHTDLREADQLADIFYRDNEALMQWIDEEDWEYSRTFKLSESMILGEQVNLVCEGLDTLAEVYVNDQLVLDAANMFRSWQVAVKEALRLGENTIRVRLKSPLPLMQAGRDQRKLRESNTYFDKHNGGRGYIRKMACSFGWDWGPVAPTAGIWKPIRLEFIKGPVIEDALVVQHHSSEGCELEIQCACKGDAETLEAELRLNEECIAETSQGADDSVLRLKVENPELWWPNTLGEQPLYTLSVTVTSREGKRDSWTRRIGLRSLELVREKDEAGESFAFHVNGEPVFCKGANWVPHRVYLPDVKNDEVRTLLEDAAAAHMNMIRVWGGGIYESDGFYDACDELGILVWQDFAFACGQYPSWDEAFRKEIGHEAADNIRRLRHHPALAIWCGNNELEMMSTGRPDYPWEEYTPLFDESLAATCRQFDPQRTYWPSSPHTPIGDRNNFNDMGSGDAHLWSVFFGHQSFESQREWTCRFMSEYGFQSFPGMKTIEAFTRPEDRNAASYILDYHQRSQAGNRTIVSYILDWFQAPESFEQLTILSQLAHSFCVRYAAEHLRRIQPHCMGVLYWQINDIWPAVSWSSIDCFGRWKVLHYEAARFFAPIHASIEEKLLEQSARIHVSNQTREPEELRVIWEVTDTDGCRLLRGEKLVSVPAQAGADATEVDCAPLLQERFAHDLLIWTWVEKDGVVVSRNASGLARPKHLSLADPELEWEVSRDGRTLSVSARKPALFVRLDCRNDVIFSDNFFALHPGEPRKIEVRRGTLDADSLSVNSLADWMLHRKADEPIPEKPEGYQLQRKLVP